MSAHPGPLWSRCNPTEGTAHCLNLQALRQFFLMPRQSYLLLGVRLGQG